jgi:Fibronectin type III domain
MGHRHHETKAKENLKIRSFRNKIAQIKNLYGYAANKKIDMLSIWNYICVFTLFFFCLTTSGYAMDVTLQWTPNNEPNLAGYKVFCRQEGQGYQYTHPYWETIDSACTIYDLDKTKTYYFVVKAFDSKGFESNNSNEVCFKSKTIPDN